MFGLGNLFKRNPTVKQETAQKTIVMCRYVSNSSSLPSQHWESEVVYDAWGTPFIRGDSYSPWDRSRLSKITPYGSIPGMWVGEWRHKSGPPVDFNNADPSKSWFPPNPNDNIPL